MLVSWDGYHEKNGDLMVSYPLVICHLATENDHRKFVDLPINSMVDLSIAM